MCIAVPFNMCIKSLIMTFHSAPALTGARYIPVMIPSTPCFRELLYFVKKGYFKIAERDFEPETL